MESCSQKHFLSTVCLALVLVVSFFSCSTLAARSGDATAFIIGGSPTTAHEFPSMVSIKLRDIHICGGSLIDNRHVITAANCVFRYRFMYAEALAEVGLTVVLAEHHQETKSGDEITIPITKIDVHYSYSNQEHFVDGDDIAVIKLTQSVTRSDKVDFAVLPEQNKEPSVVGESCWLIGWGSIYMDGQDPYPVLQKGQLKIIDNGACSNSFPKLAYLKGSMCAGPGPDGAQACRGDNGGPLFCPTNGKLVQVGISSYGRVPCGKTAAPSVFTRISYYRDWIDAFRNS